MTSKKSPPVIYDLASLKSAHRRCQRELLGAFVDFFEQVTYEGPLDRKIRLRDVKEHSDLDHVLSGAGFYLIATNLPTPTNACGLEIGSGVRVIYRGHSSTVRERIESHLFNGRYRESGKGRKFEVCMLLDGKNIDIDITPLTLSKWTVVTHSMPGSLKLVREAAELAFDQKFGRPIGSDK